MDEWSIGMEHRDDEGADNVDEEIEIEDEELGLDCELAQKTEDPIQEMTTCLEVQAKIEADLK